jgi:hypothetical protein
MLMPQAVMIAGVFVLLLRCRPLPAESCPLAAGALSSVLCTNLNPSKTSGQVFSLAKALLAKEMVFLGDTPYVHDK